MADVTDEDLAEKRETLDELRAQIAEANAAREEHERQLAREIDMKKLEAEEARLRLELTNARIAAGEDAVLAGAAQLVDTIEASAPVVAPVEAEEPETKPKAAPKGDAKSAAKE